MMDQELVYVSVFVVCVCVCVCLCVCVCVRCVVSILANIASPEPLVIWIVVNLFHVPIHVHVKL